MNDIALSQHEFDLFREFIYQNAGVKLHEGKSALVSSRLHKRLRHHNLGNYTAYYQLINGKACDTQERQRAIDLLTTNETYFFREPKHFEFLQNLLKQNSMASQFRVWSAASSTGEEAYSIALTIADAKVGNWEVMGTDISQTVLSKARAAVYSTTAEQNIATHLLKKFCLKGIGDATGTLRIDSSITKNVRFTHANLQTAQNGLGKFDIAFLRNVMIYFDQATKQRVLSNVLSQLKPNGYLFIGHAESLNGLSHSLSLIQPAVYQLRP